MSDFENRHPAAEAYSRNWRQPGFADRWPDRRCVAPVFLGETMFAPTIRLRTNMNMITTEAEERRYAELQLLALDSARAGETELLARMIQHGLSINLADAKGNTLLMLACYHQNVDTARMLLEHQAEVDRRNHRGQTPLGGAAFKGYEDIVALLLAHGAEIDADNGSGMTPLMFAAMFGRTRVMEQLQAHGASLQRRNRLGLSANFLVRLARSFACLFRPSLPTKKPV